MLKLGYKASAEQFGPTELLDFSRLAEEVAFDSVFVSDHFQPWKHNDGHAPNSLAWLGALGASTKRVVIGTSVATPTFRYHPSIVAQAFGTLGSMFPGRVVLGVGTGESLNEVPATGMQWPGPKERRDRLREAVRLINTLWTQERVTFEGQFYKTDRATIYDKPKQKVPIWVAASGPLAAAMAGQIAEGFICTSGKASARRSISTGSSTPVFSSGESASAAQCRVSSFACCASVSNDTLTSIMRSTASFGRPDLPSPSSTFAVRSW